MDRTVSISVIVPVFNRKDLLKETINSVLEQTVEDWELILVDDGSVDGALEFSETVALKNNRVLHLRNTTGKKGASICRNLGLKAASGNYIMFLDSDDLISKKCIENRIAVINENSDLDFLVFPMLLFKRRVDDLRLLQNKNTDENPLDRFLKRENVWLQPLWKKYFFQESLRGYSENFLSFQDWEINVRALLTGARFKFFDSMPPDVFYRQHSDTISVNRYGESHTISNLKMIFEIFEILKTTNHFSEDRRMWLAGFFTDLVNRFRYFTMTNAEKESAQKQWMDQALQFALLSKSEFTIVQRYLKISRSYFYARFKLYRNRVENRYKRNLLKAFYPIGEKYQGKIEYHGKID